MPINITLADTSNGLLLSTVVIYAIAMLCYACDFAFAKHRVLGNLTEKADVAPVPELAVPELAVPELAVPELAGAAAGGRGRVGGAAPAYRRPPLLAACRPPTSRPSPASRLPVAGRPASGCAWRSR